MRGRGLRRAVGGELRRGIGHCGRGDQDERAARALEQRVGGAGGGERAREVEVELAAEPIDVERRRRSERGPAHIGDHAVEPPEVRPDGLDRRGDLLAVTHVGGHPERLGPRGLERGRDLLERLGRASVNRDARTALGQMLGDPAPDPARRTGDEDHLAGDVERRGQR